MKVHTSCIIYEVGELQNNAAVHEGTTTGASRGDRSETRYGVCRHSIKSAWSRTVKLACCISSTKMAQPQKPVQQQPGISA